MEKGAYFDGRKFLKCPVIKVLTENNYFQHFEVLKNNRNKRFSYNEFFVEGVRNINAAILNNWQIQSLLYSSGKPLSDWAKGILKDSPCEHFELAGALMDKLSLKDDTSELIAIIKIPPDDLSRVHLEKELKVVVFDRPSNKGNLGTIIRSCDALGAQGLIITGHAVDLYDPETVRASMGSLFKLPVVRVPSFYELKNWIAGLKQKNAELCLVGTSEKGEVDIDQFDFKRPVILLVGNETFGLTANFLEMSDVLLKIPMSGDSAASSLNVACAASICLYEINRQRRQIA
jgi:23S rRNA (uridine2479-2'-O)-methyltransferase